MNSKREYFRKSFSWKKCMHFIISGIIVTTIVLLYYFLKIQKDSSITSIRIAKDITFIVGITLLSYSGLLWIAFSGFGLSLFKSKKNKYEKENDLNRKIQAEKNKPNSKEKEIRIKILTEQYNSEKQARIEKENKPKYNFVLAIIALESIIFLITAGILSRF